MARKMRFVLLTLAVWGARLIGLREFAIRYADNVQADRRQEDNPNVRLRDYYTRYGEGVVQI